MSDGDLGSGGSAPVRAYLVCASQRSGSTLLVESLAQTGVAGAPQEFFQYFATSSQAPQPREWFAGVRDSTILDLLAAPDPGQVDGRDTPEWIADVRVEGSTPNGVWGGKLMWNQTPLLTARTRVASGSLRTAIQTLFDGFDPLFIYVSRDDVVAQAVSMWRAVQTQVWRDDGQPTTSADPQYHAGGIAHLATILAHQDRSWQAWFDAESISPLRVPFTGLVNDPTATTAAVLAALDQDPALAPPPPLKPQSDELSREWALRYRRDAERKGLPT